MTPNLIHIIYNMYTIWLYSWDFYTLATFRSITLQKQQRLQIQEDLGLFEVKAQTFSTHMDPELINLVSETKSLYYFPKPLDLQNFNSFSLQVTSHYIKSLDVWFSTFEAVFLF